ncbi:hypothetical protein [Ruminococcus flavefaciens]|uniref:Uncharacterized protein n=1 Tax=Ruminococcus flavefaciens 007c TaxID=1341157 RepID=W7V066_RUMFL|nr:hypothetical protein [Ruminococcus flavefaciens]EWM54435.1 hypothetical protein RF007C_12565 [Ruminococcus flavefaciens 007c]
MNSFYWQVISYISLGLGIVMILIALFIAVRFGVFANLFSGLMAKKTISDPIAATNTTSNILSLKTERDMYEREKASADEGKDDDIITVVIGKKSKENISDTIVVANGSDSNSDFRIIKNVLLINADVDVIDDHRRNR